MLTTPETTEEEETEEGEEKEKRPKTKTTKETVSEWCESCMASQPKAGYWWRISSTTHLAKVNYCTNELVGQNSFSPKETFVYAPYWRNIL